jgi:hypothetical protein
MNALGLRAFLAGGYTDWRELEVPLNPEATFVQVDVVVANVADGVVDSSVYVDFVEEIGTAADIVQPTSPCCYSVLGQ